MPLRKLAVFTEGPTELVFMKRLLEEIAGRNNITFEIAEQKWNQLITLESSGDEDCRYFALLVSCGHDEQVVTFMKDQAESIVLADYDAVVGLRDVYPRPRSDFQFLKNLWQTELADFQVPAEIFAAVMEIEAWFVQEWTHFERYDPALTMEVIEGALGFNPSTEEAALLNHPSDFLDRAYRLAGHKYSKKGWQQQAVVDHLDIDSMYIDMPAQVPEFGRLIERIDDTYIADPET